MSKRAKFLTGGLAAILVAAALVGWVMAQGSNEQPTTTAAPSQTFLSRVAANLGVEEERLIEAITQVRYQMIDEAVEQGRITQQQADRMKQQIEGRQAILQMIDEAIEQGRITQEQADQLKQRIGGRKAMGWELQGFQGHWGGHGQGGPGHRGGCPMTTPPQSPSP